MRLMTRSRWLLLAALGSVALAVSITVLQAWMARSELHEFARESRVASTETIDGNLAPARAAVRRAQQHASSASGLTSGPNWWLAERLPVLGDDFAAMATLADVARVMSHEAAPKALAAADVFGPSMFRQWDGRFQVRPLIEQAASSAGLALTNLIEINSIAILKSALLADMGATLLPLAPLRAEIESGLLATTPVEHPPIRRSVTLCASRNIPLTNAAAAISRLVRQVTETLCANGDWPGARLRE